MGWAAAVRKLSLLSQFWMGPFSALSYTAPPALEILAAMIWPVWRDCWDIDRLVLTERLIGLDRRRPPLMVEH